MADVRRSASTWGDAERPAINRATLCKACGAALLLVSWAVFVTVVFLESLYPDDWLVAAFRWIGGFLAMVVGPGVIIVPWAAYCARALARIRDVRFDGEGLWIRRDGRPCFFPWSDVANVTAPNGQSFRLPRDIHITLASGDVVRVPSCIRQRTQLRLLAEKGIEAGQHQD